jgi:predicted AlkP superfamily pyrophosphatase or phosphodiesterase
LSTATFLVSRTIVPIHAALVAKLKRTTSAPLVSGLLILNTLSFWVLLTSGAAGRGSAQANDRSTDDAHVESVASFGQGGAMSPARLARSFLLLATSLVLAACAALDTPAPAPEQAASGPVILISMDGFRADLLDRGLTPTLFELAAEGARAQYMRPSFPTLTYPNHYTLVTGLRPDRHGIVANTIEDDTLGRFDRDTVDPRWWDAGTPLWVLAERAGIRSATLFWPGSYGAIQGVRPTHWAPFRRITAAERVDMLLGWFDGPAAERPGFAALYLDEVDIAGHAQGATGPQMDAAAVVLDQAIARLIAGLKARGAYDGANLIIVSDHGMMDIDPARITYTEQLVSPDIAVPVQPGAFTEFRLRPGKAAQAEAALLAPHPDVECLRKTDLPARFHYGRNPRISPIVCMARPGALLRRRGQVVTRGDHGFDPDLPEMRAVMIARGPAFRSGVMLAPFDNVDIYPLAARLLGVTPAPSDGKLSSTLPALR